MVGQERQVLARQLVLEGLGRRRDDDPLAALQGGHEVGERLADAGARLDHEMVLVDDGPTDRLGHRLLTGTDLTAAGESCGDAAQRGNDIRCDHLGRR